MKKKREVLSGVGTMLLLMSVASCNNNVKDKSAEADACGASLVELESYKYDVIAAYPDSDALDVEGGKYWRFSGSGILPLKVGDKDVTTLRDSLMRLAKMEMPGKDKAAPLLDDDLTATTVSPDSAKACSQSVNQISVALTTPELVVWKNFYYTYMCRAAHGFYSTTYINYGIEDGKILSVADLMQPGYEQKLTKLIRNRISENKVPLLESVDSVSIPNNFELTTDGINFIYGLYEITPYAAGEITIEFKSYELDSLLTPAAATRYFGILPD